MPFRKLVSLLLCLPASIAAQTATTQPSPDQVFQELRRHAQQQYIQQQADLKLLGERRLEQLVELRRDGDFLRIDIRIDPTNEPLRVTVLPKELPGRVDIRASQDGRYVTADMQIADFTQPGELHRQTSISLNPLSISLACFVDGTLGSRAVQLFQTQDDGDVLLRLIVQEESEFSADVNLQYEARSFTDLRRKHGREVQKYLAPVLRGLGIEVSLFAPSLALAQQAMGIGSGSDSELLSQLEPLLAKCDSPDFRTRHNASQALRKLDRAKLIALARADRSKWSLNRKAAVDALLAETDIPQLSDLSDFGKDPVFLIDCLYLDDVAVRREAAKRLDALAGRRLAINADDPIEKRVATVDRLVDLFVPATRIEQSP